MKLSNKAKSQLLVGGLKAELSTLRSRLAAAEREADAEHAKLVEVADKLRAERAALEQAEAALGRARELLERWRGLCCAALPTESVADVDAATRAFLAATPNTTKPTEST